MTIQVKREVQTLTESAQIADDTDKGKDKADSEPMRTVRSAELSGSEVMDTDQSHGNKVLAELEAKLDKELEEMEVYMQTEKQRAIEASKAMTYVPKMKTPNDAQTTIGHSSVVSVWVLLRISFHSQIDSFLWLKIALATVQL